MARPKAIARVRADLAAGRTDLAARRLRSLLAEDPNDLRLRHMMATVHRRTGNIVEAGRWAFLDDDVRPEELAAFSRSHPSPWIRLRLLHWSGPLATIPGEAARNRLHALMVAAQQYGPPPRPGPPPPGPPAGAPVPGRGRGPARGPETRQGKPDRGRGPARGPETRQGKPDRGPAPGRPAATRRDSGRNADGDRSSRIPCLYVSVVLLIFTALVVLGVIRVAYLFLGFLSH